MNHKVFAMKQIIRVFAVIAILLAWQAAPSRAQRTVFAHYMITNQDYQGDTDPTGELKVAAYEREIQQAQAAGIDGFALNCGGWFHESTNNYYYVRYSAQMFEAAVRLNSGFKLMFSADMTASNSMTDVEDMMRRFCNDPRYSTVYFQHNGKYVLSTFSGDNNGTAYWQQVKSDLATGANPYTPPTGFATASNAPLNIELVTAFFWGGELPNQSSIQSGFSQWSSVLDGSFYWGIAGTPGSGDAEDQIPSSESYASVVHAGGKIYMAPVCLQFWGANANRYYEYSGYQGLRRMWMDAINVSHPDWVEIITWNDFIEGSYVSPIDDPNKYQFANFLGTIGVPDTTLGYFHSHYGATGLLPYFIQWYKTGVQPAITNDSIFWAYRTEPMSYNAGIPSVGNKYGPVADVVYVTCNLAAPAVLKVTSGSVVNTVNVPAGSTDVSVPFVAGTTPAFELDRNGSVVCSGTGTDQIQATPQYNDYYYSTGDVIGPPFNAAPSTPANLTATAGNNSVGLTWTASTGSVPLTYNIYRGTSSGGESGTPLATGVITASYTDNTAVNGTTYYYTVKGVNSLGTSGASNEASARPVAPTPASIPVGLTATAGDAQIALTWSASTGTAPITYSVYRGTTSGGEGSAPIASGLTATSYTDKGLANGTTYYYKVSATNPAGTTAQSAEVSAKTLTAVVQINAGGSAASPFAADTDFDTGTAYTNATTIDTSGVTNPAPQTVYQSVRWNASFNYTIPGLTAGANYLVRLHFAELSFTGAGQRLFNVAINGVSTLSNFDVFAAAGGQYRAVVKEFTVAANSSGQIVIAFTKGTADNPDIAGIEVFGGSASNPTAPAAPTGLTAAGGNAQAALSWTASSGATSYNVYRGTSAGGESGTAIASGITTTSYTDTGLTNGTTYYYKVTAVNSVGTSGLSNEASATPAASGGGQPDLVVTSVTLSPASPNAGDHVVFTAVVKNQGTGATPAGTVLGVGFDLDGSQAATTWEDTDTASLAAGASITLTATGGTAGTNYWTATAGSHTVTAWVDDVNRIAESNENNNTLAQTFAVGSSGTGLTAVAQINCGGSAVSPFAADADFNTGNAFSSAAAIVTSGAVNPAPAAVYQTCRWASSFTYTIPGLTAGASYTVRLHFAELTWTATGQRKFNVAINGASALSAFDIFGAAGGQNKAVTEQFTTTANSSGQIVIAFTQGGADNPEVNGIEVLH